MTEQVWVSSELKEIHNPEPLESKPLYRRLAFQLKDRMIDAYEEFTGDEFDVEEIALDVTEGIHTYVVKDTLTPFFVALPTRVEKQEDPLTGEDKVYVISEYRIPLREDTSTTVQ